MDKSKHCALTIRATFRTLGCVEQEMTWIAGTSGKSAYKNATTFFSQWSNF